MKKIILIGATLLATSSAILIANTNESGSRECCAKPQCEQGVCKPTTGCSDPGECCTKQ